MKRFLLLISGLLLSVTFLFGDNYRVNTEVLNVRSSPDRSAQVVGVLRDGEVVAAETTSDPAWLKITYNGKSAYVASSYLEFVPPLYEGPSDGGPYSSYHILGVLRERLVSAGLPDLNVLILLAVTLVLLAVASFMPGKAWGVGLVCLFLASCSTIYMTLMYVSGGVVTGFDLELDPMLSMAVEFVALGSLVFVCSFAILKTMLNASIDISWAWGWLAWLLSSVPVLVDYYHSWNIAGFVILGLLAYQAGFCVWAFVKFVRKRRFLAVLPVLVTYLVSSVAATILISSFTTLFSNRIWM